MKLSIEYKEDFPNLVRIKSDKKILFFEKLKSKNNFIIENLTQLSIEILPYYEGSILNKIFYYFNFLLILLTGMSDENLFNNIKSTCINFDNLKFVDKLNIEIFKNIEVIQNVEYKFEEYVNKKHYITFFLIFCLPIFILLTYLFINLLSVQTNSILKYVLLTFIFIIFSILFYKNFKLIKMIR
ncbi:hypothetical protein ABGF25_07890 [Helcococcus ovis]|uniref:hypothetical protein n=1 Tax=Helcococcus ovis TaxID=72026 RepID=UPI0038B9FD34